MFIYHHHTPLQLRAHVLILFLFTLAPQPTYAIFSLQKATTFLKRTPHEKIEQKKYDIPHTTTLTVKNIYGSITIATKTATDPLDTILFIQATKKTSTKEFCDEMSFSSLIDGAFFHITSNDTPANRSGTIDYHLIVPAHLTLILETEKGNITAEETHGMITATTLRGNITCTDTHHVVTAHTKEQGSITIEQAYKPIYATTKKGPIIIHDASEAITACTDKGKIVAHCANVPSQGFIHLKTNAGHISLHLPSATNADLSAQTTHGTVTSDHLITLHPQKTRLNTHAWNNFKKEVHGVVGSLNAPSSSIVLNSLNSNIKIFDSATT